MERVRPKVNSSKLKTERIIIKPPMNRLTFRHLTSEDSFLLREFCSILKGNSSDRNTGGSFKKIRDNLELSEKGRHGKNGYHVLVALKKEEIVGGAVFNYFPKSECGVLEYIFVTARHRGKKYSRAILEKVEKTLQQGAVRYGTKLAGIFGEVEIPFMISGGDMDPWLRLLILGKLGFNRVDFNYRKLLSPIYKKPAQYLMLLFKGKSLREQSIEPSRFLDFLADYLQWAVHIKQMKKGLPKPERSYLPISEKLVLEPLSVYCGEDDKHYYFKEPKNKKDPDIRKALKIYKKSFTEREFAIPTDLFLELIDKKSKRMLNYKYHFLILKKRDSEKVIGFTEFFTLKTACFGGYVAIRKDQQGKGLFKRMLRRIERTMSEELGDAPSKIHGWFVEFEKPQKTMDPFAENRLKIMLRMGFHPLKLIYDQPILPEYVSNDTTIQDKLYLAFKPFGDFQEYEITRKPFLNFIMDLLRDCFYIDHPGKHKTFVSIKKQVSGFKKVPFEKVTLNKLSCDKDYPIPDSEGIERREHELPLSPR